MRTSLIIVTGFICLILAAGCATIQEKPAEKPAEETLQEPPEPAVLEEALDHA